MITKEQILEALKTVIDPELHINIVDLGLVYDVQIVHDLGHVEITMTLTTPGCPLSMVFEEWIPKAVKAVDGVKSVMINLVWEPAWDPEKISDDMKEELGLIR
jgi:metal-sulfur cluster biosynthetic enzyme